MPTSVIIAVQTLRAEQRRVVHGPMMPRLWRAMRGEWQRRRDRAMAQPGPVAASAPRAMRHAG